MQLADYILALIALCVLKASLVWSIRLTVVGALARIGAARVLCAGCKINARVTGPLKGEGISRPLRRLSFISQVKPRIKTSRQKHLEAIFCWFRRIRVAAPTQ